MKKLATLDLSELPDALVVEIKRKNILLKAVKTHLPGSTKTKRGTLEKNAETGAKFIVTEKQTLGELTGEFDKLDISVTGINESRAVIENVKQNIAYFEKAYAEQIALLNERLSAVTAIKAQVAELETVVGDVEKVSSTL